MIVEDHQKQRKGGEQQKELRPISGVARISLYSVQLPAVSEVVSFLCVCILNPTSLPLFFKLLLSD